MTGAADLSAFDNLVAHFKAVIRIVSIQAEGTELNTIRQLFREYQEELNENLCFQSFDAELKNPLIKYGHPSGELLLAFYGGEIAGCVALTKLSADDCEMKRLYVRPSFRGAKIGRLLAEEIITVARQRGYRRMKLDTLKKLAPAIRLYEELGFRHTTAYYSNPISDVVYMEKDLLNQTEDAATH